MTQATPPSNPPAPAAAPTAAADTDSLRALLHRLTNQAASEGEGGGGAIHEEECPVCLEDVPAEEVRLLAPLCSKRGAFCITCLNESVHMAISCNFDTNTIPAAGLLKVDFYYAMFSSEASQEPLLT